MRVVIPGIVGPTTMRKRLRAPPIAAPGTITMVMVTDITATTTITHMRRAARWASHLR
jgi:hypothetical protein